MSYSQSTKAARTYNAFDMLVASTGTPQCPFGYAGGYGYQEDGDSALKLLGHRYYDASTGRFLTRDPVKDGRNWYSYCENGPTVRLDPNGLGIVDWIKEKWYDLTVAKEPIDVIKPPAAGLAASVMAWAIWKLADVAKGQHRPPGFHAKPPWYDRIPGPGPVRGKPSLPPDSNIRMGRTAENQAYWLDPDK